MATYIMLSRLTERGAETVKSNPERIMQVDRELEEMGVHVKEQYATLGEYDFVNIIEAPDNLSVERASVDMAARGTVHIETLPAIPIEQLISGMKR